MKPEDVPAEWVDLAEVIYDGGEIAGAMRRALAAVIPLVQKEEREACAGVADDMCDPYGADDGYSARAIAAAIRALPLTGDEP